MPFQGAVYNVQSTGVPGDQAFDTPWKAETFTINSTNAAYNIIGATACTITGQGFCAAGKSSVNAAFAGILVDPKAVALFGIGSQPLTATLTVPNFATVECATMGSFFVTLPAVASIGDKVVYDNTTGVLSTISTANFQLTGILTSGSATITMGFTTNVVVGQQVSGTGIPAGSTVVSIIPSTSITISANATATGSQTLTFTPSGNDLPSGKSFAGALVDYYNVTNAGLAVISMTPTFVIPHAA